MHRFLSLACLLCALSAQGGEPLPSVGYALAESWREKDSQPARYHPLNVLDGRDTTVWCAEGRPGPLTIGFKGVAAVDEVRLSTGHGESREAFKAHGRARQLTLQGTEEARAL